TDFSGDSHRYTYDTSGPATTRNALLSVQHPNGATDNFVYDPQGRLAATNRNGNADQRTYTYGRAGEVSAADANGGTSRYFFDARGLIAKVEDALGNATHYVYDSSFNLVQVIDASGQATIANYDQQGNLIQTTGPNGEITKFNYAGPFD